MIRRLLSAIVGLIAVYIVLTFVYSQFPETRAAMGNMKEFVSYAYDWSVAQWGTTAVGGALVLLLVMTIVRR
ncbi:hypothetical protein [Priestia megaterium]